MTTRVIAKKDFPGFVAGLTKQAELYAPSQVPGKDYSRFARIKDADDICFDYLNTKLPVKELFFPQREALFVFKPGQSENAQAPAPVPKRIVLGVRPCDAASLLLLDKVFLAEPVPADSQSPSVEDNRESEIRNQESFTDPYYAERREKTTLVGLACNEPGEACFCTALAGSPHGTAGLDLLLVALKDRYLAKPVTRKGEKLIDSLPEAKTADLDEAQKLAEAAAGTIKFTLDSDVLKARLDSGFESDTWEELSLPCVNCGICTYVCPTCHCFDVTDEEDHGKCARIRTWDSCQFALFTRHASGHNPRPQGKDRMRQRTMHKFSYFPDAWGGFLCVGCGRCITECPAGIDLRETLSSLATNPHD